MSSCLSLSLIERAIIDILRGEDEDDDEEGGSCGRCIWCPTLATPNLYHLVLGSLGFYLQEVYIWCLTNTPCKQSVLHKQKQDSINPCPSNHIYFPRSQLSFHSQRFQVNRNKLQTNLSLKDFNHKVLVCYSNMSVCTGWGS